MIVFPNCKINLGLSVVRKREDGFHELQTVFYPVSLTDILEIIPAPRLKPDLPSLNLSGTSIAGDLQSNLCIKAWMLLKKDFSFLPPAHMHLHKLVPAGAGLGGGSADGAFALALLNRLFDLSLSQGQLAAYAAKLGSDCPFFVINKPCAATGRGEILEEIELSLENYSFVLVHPPIHINTGWAFQQLRLRAAAASVSIKEIVQQPVETWKNALVNDFEEPAFQHYPIIAALKYRLYELGALYASLSGSGSTVFGIFKKEYLPEPDLFPDCGVYHIK